MSDAKIDKLLPNRTKIVATIGPASRTPHILRQLIEAGVDVFRLNFSHGTHEEHSATLRHIRALSNELDQHVAILQDLCGPKIRLGTFPEGSVECHLGEEFTLVTEGSANSTRELTCSYCELPNELNRGETVLFADGAVAMTVTDISPGRARLRVTIPGTLRSRQGVNLPGSELNVSSLTQKDLRDLDWTAHHAKDVDFVGLSFVRSADDVAQLRHELQSRNCKARIVVKIEKPQAVQNIEAIVLATDCVMVARGDLGVEMDVQRVPAIQKRVIALCNQAHRPVITATQMLNSMEHSKRPTRAEASDVFNAVIDGTDAVMLSGESAIGEYPVEAVTTMREICIEAEAYVVSNRRAQLEKPSSLREFIQPITEATVDAAYLVTEQLKAPLIVVATESGRTALALSNRRPAATVLALTRSEQVARALAVCWGTMPLVTKSLSSDQEVEFGMRWAESNRFVRPGEHVVFLRGQLAGRPRRRAVLVEQAS